MAHCVVLGANGFIGSSLVTQLLTLGHTVRCFDRINDDTHLRFDSKNPSIEVMNGDFHNNESLAQAVDGMDYVFHLISTTNPRLSDEDPTADVRSNITQSIALFQAATKAGVKKVLFASTGGAMYGDKPDTNIIDESVLPEPTSPYAIGKLTIEHYLRYFKKKHNLDYTVYRISNPYGPGQTITNGQGVIGIFMKKIMDGEPITIFGDGSMVRDYIYIDDAVDAIANSFDKVSNHDLYHISAGVGTSVNQLVAALENASQSTPETTHLETPATFVHTTVLSNRRLEESFGKRNYTSLEDGLGKTWQALKK